MIDNLSLMDGDSRRVSRRVLSLTQRPEGPPEPALQRETENLALIIGSPFALDESSRRWLWDDLAMSFATVWATDSGVTCGKQAAPFDRQSTNSDYHGPVRWKGEAGPSGKSLLSRVLSLAETLLRSDVKAARIRVLVLDADPESILSASLLSSLGARVAYFDGLLSGPPDRDQWVNGLPSTDVSNSPSARSLDRVASLAVGSDEAVPESWIPLPVGRFMTTWFLSYGRDLPFSLPEGARELISQRIHRGYVEQSESATENPWPLLPEPSREANRAATDGVLDRAQRLGQLKPNESGESCVFQQEAATFSEADLEVLSEYEHARWTVDKLVDGWRFHSTRCDDRLFHQHIVKWDDLDTNTRKKDRQNVTQGTEILEELLSQSS